MFDFARAVITVRRVIDMTDHVHIMRGEMFADVIRSRRPRSSGGVSGASAIHHT